ncbi:hypothetical protein D3C72_1968850 [compost metagenome]
MMTRAAAPSFTPGALPAVMVPSGEKAGRSLARVSAVVSGRMDSSILKDLVSFLPTGTSTAMTSCSKRPSLQALSASWWLRADHASCSSRVMPYSAATVEPWMPM